ncbi:HTH-type transcriptional activator RhaS [Flavobacterium bizetiae]|uniref:HTH-type transcriptional activator RhaS n=1 Tax=Flavobacterium bizetiae TaxID=2704140 RepID=A0A6J4GXM2_9FLAO|nr:AraC family transcriptional regulator [Flavobacterium bizetiae]CAA9203635.1 HTH-type transcriptional activator RhaS [Flavobacterium bizetiae]CAD5343039.1 HTH-type transcriptional activator RhaS [Flavobacterium bizetiae]CAD5350430.1 HTH-type transcriptional activator RhaS [Flavobacterium bizetiae]
MVNDYKKHDLYGKTLIQKIELTPPFKFDFPVTEQACFLYVKGGDLEYQIDDEPISIATHYSLLLNCINSGKQIYNSKSNCNCEIVIVTFYPEILKKIYDRELPLLLQTPNNIVSNKSSEKINNDFLIQKYIEGLLFYFENPSLINEDILVLKVKEIILLLSQTQNSESVQLILSQLFSPATYTFKQIIEANLFSQLSVEELAQQHNLSVSSFKREFVKIYQDTPANYIKTKKLEKAAQLLEVSDQRINEIAFDCGFNDLANFTKSFTGKYSVSPTNYRQRSKNL